MTRELLEKYADLLVEQGVNPAPGQEVLIQSDIDQPEFVRMLTEKFYRYGAGRVVIQWRDVAADRLHYLWQPEKMLSEVPPWELALWQWRRDKMPALLWLYSDDPEGMNGVDAEKIAAVQKAQYLITKPWQQAIENRYQYCVAAVPSIQWARRLFPGSSETAAVDKLWAAILHAARADRADCSPIAEVRRNNEEINRRRTRLNELKLTALEYHTDRGTDFRAGLLPEGLFCGAVITDRSGRKFNANIPSEEIFTVPERGAAEGIVYAVEPISWQGMRIEDFSIRFENGRAVEVKAAKNQEALERMIAMDEGAAYLGECALIDYNSPIRETGLFFCNSLLDENASCHLALGRGYKECIRNYEKFSAAELRAMGVNDSMIHVDFMIGDRTLNVDGITASGEKIAIFRNGSWCI